MIGAERLTVLSTSYEEFDPGFLTRAPSVTPLISLFESTCRDIQIRQIPHDGNESRNNCLCMRCSAALRCTRRGLGCLIDSRQHTIVIHGTGRGDGIVLIGLTKEPIAESDRKSLTATAAFEGTAFTAVTFSRIVDALSERFGLPCEPRDTVSDRFEEHLWFF
jgi:hypothetical protein